MGAEVYPSPGTPGATGATGPTGPAGPASNGIGVITGDLTTPAASSPAQSVAGTLASVGTAGTYGSASLIPVITTDAKGRVTSVTTAAPAAGLTSVSGKITTANYADVVLPAGTNFARIAMSPYGGYVVADGWTDEVSPSSPLAVAMTNLEVYLEGRSPSLPASFSAMTLPTSQQWISVCYGNGKFVAVPVTTGTAGAYSTDGITWTTMTLPTSQQWISVCYGNGKFVAVPATTGTAGAYFAMKISKPTYFSIIHEDVTTAY
jgi:hypothetical protein